MCISAVQCTAINCIICVGESDCKFLMALLRELMKKNCISNDSPCWL